MTRPRQLYILGTSGLAREAAQVVKAVDPDGLRWIIGGFVGGSTADVGRDLGYGNVVGGDDWLLDGEQIADLVIGIGRPAIRARLAATFLSASDRFGWPTIIHPRALVDSRRTRLGQGNLITAGCVFTVDITVGEFNYINLNSTVGHDTTIGSYNVINPGSNLSGNVTLGDRILIGTGAQLLEHVRVGSDATVGAGAVVRDEVADGATVVGVPARPLQQTQTNVEMLATTGLMGQGRGPKGQRRRRRSSPQ